MSNRIPRINELIKREVSSIIFREIEFPNGVLVTVTRVTTSSDLRDSNIFLSVLPENRTETVHKILNKQMYFVQQKFNNILKMRPLPRLKFLKEKETIEADRVEGILEKIKDE